MIFPCANRALCGILAMLMWGRKLELGIIVADETYYFVRSFIVDFMQIWFVSFHFEVIVYRLVCLQKFLFRPVFDGNALDIVCVINIKIMTYFMPRLEV